MRKQGSFITTILVLALAAALIFGVNQFLMAEEAKEEKVNPFAGVYPTATDQVEEIEVEGYEDKFNKVYKIKDESGADGYIFEALGNGYGGEFVYQVGVSADGTIQGFKVLSHNETEGFGASFNTPEYASSLTGTKIGTGKLTSGDPNPEEGQIELISGATVTTNAITDSLTTVANSLSTLSEDVQAVVKELPYYPDKWQELFTNLISEYEFKEFEGKDFYRENGIRRIIEAKNKKTNEISYLVQATASGIAGDIDYILRLAENYRVFGIEIGNHSEAADKGGKIEDPVYKDLIKGLNLDKNFITKATKLRKEPKHEKDILLISGATVTSKAMKDSLDQVIEDLIRFNKLRKNEDMFKLINFDDLESDKKQYDHSLFEGVEATEVIAENVNDEVLAVSDAGDLGKIYDVNSEGFGGMIEFGILVDDDGLIKDFVIYQHSETPGFGAAIEEDSYKNQIVGKNLNEIGDVANEVDAIAGSTITTNGMHAGLNAVKEAFKAQ